MGLFDSLFKRPAKTGEGSDRGAAWETLTAYRPMFTTWDGKLYENELIRASVDAIARHTSKLDVSFNGPAKAKLKRECRIAPNPWMTWGQFLYRLRTIYELQCTAIVVPVYDDFGDVSGYFPVLFTQCEIVQYGGVPYLRYKFSNGKTAAIELDACGILTKYQYMDDVFGTSNGALRQTMELVNMQAQGIAEGVKNGATFRFMARLNNFLKPEDVAKERKRFNRENLQDESGGILLFPNTYNDIKQVDQKPFVVDHDQMSMIQQNVYSYFGVNEDILQNKSFGDAWNAFYEGGRQRKQHLCQLEQAAVSEQQRQAPGEHAAAGSRHAEQGRGQSDMEPASAAGWTGPDLRDPRGVRERRRSGERRRKRC